MLDPVALIEEIEMVKSAGVDISGRLLISHNAHLIMPYHKLLDKLFEQGDLKIANPTDKIESLLMITRLIRVFETYNSVEAAVASYKKRTKNR